MPTLGVTRLRHFEDHRRAMISRGVLAPGSAFLQKPFSVEQLQRKLREVLD
jgi:hypothetical protein